MPQRELCEGILEKNMIEEDLLTEVLSEMFQMSIKAMATGDMKRLQQLLEPGFYKKIEQASNAIGTDNKFVEFT